MAGNDAQVFVVLTKIAHRVVARVVVDDTDFSIDTVDGPTYTLNSLLQVILDVVADYDNRKFHGFWLVSDMHLCMLG